MLIIFKHLQRKEKECLPKETHGSKRIETHKKKEDLKNRRNERVVRNK